jgi:spermidine/putrescine transport system substrate-binding protein
MPENAILNMEEIGYVSVVASPEILEWANDEEVEEVSNLSYFFGEGAEAVHANHVFYPDQSVIERCALMHDCGEKTEAMLAMWSRVKGDNLSTGLVVFILVVLAMIMVVVVLQALKRKHQRELQRKKRNRRRR